MSYSRGLIFANGKIKLKLNRVKALISESIIFYKKLDKMRARSNEQKMCVQLNESKEIDNYVCSFYLYLTK